MPHVIAADAGALEGPRSHRQPGPPTRPARPLTSAETLTAWLGRSFLTAQADPAAAQQLALLAELKVACNRSRLGSSIVSIKPEFQRSIPERSTKYFVLHYAPKLNRRPGQENEAPKDKRHVPLGGQLVERRAPSPRRPSRRPAEPSGFSVKWVAELFRAERRTPPGDAAAAHRAPHLVGDRSPSRLTDDLPDQSIPANRSSHTACTRPACGCSGRPAAAAALRAPSWALRCRCS